MVISVTGAAVGKVRADLAGFGEPGDCLRISVVGKGSSGLQFGCDFEPAQPDDQVLELNGVTVVIDPVIGDSYASRLATAALPS